MVNIEEMSHCLNFSRLQGSWSVSTANVCVLRVNRYRQIFVLRSIYFCSKLSNFVAKMTKNPHPTHSTTPPIITFSNVITHLVTLCFGYYSIELAVLARLFLQSDVHEDQWVIQFSLNSLFLSICFHLYSLCFHFSRHITITVSEFRNCKNISYN